MLVCTKMDPGQRRCSKEIARLVVKASKGNVQVGQADQ